MGEANTEKESKTSWFEGVKTEFGKIIWPDKKSLGRQTAAVVIVSIILGIIIAVLDTVFKYGVDALVGL